MSAIIPAMNVLAFDVESNGLHGAAFAVAGVLMDDKLEIISQFSSRCPITGPVDTWVSENVLGPMKNTPETAADARSMRDEFWKWYMSVKPRADIIVASNPYPVEAKFLIDCQADDMPAREFDHPFPYYDLPSMLLTLGFATPAERREFVAEATKHTSGDPHEPLWDSKATAMGAQAAIKRAGLKTPPTV